MRSCPAILFSKQPLRRNAMLRPPRDHGRYPPAVGGGRVLTDQDMALTHLTAVGNHPALVCKFPSSSASPSLSRSRSRTHGARRFAAAPPSVPFRRVSETGDCPTREQLGIAAWEPCTSNQRRVHPSRHVCAVCRVSCPSWNAMLIQ